MPSLPIRAATAFAIAALPFAALADEPSGKAPEQLGAVDFANSCTPGAQQTFTRAVALLHSFWWAEGDKTFRAVLDLDPGCAIATWGIATIAIGNPFATGPTAETAQRAQQAIDRGRAIGAKTERERLYIEAIAAYYDRFSERPHRARIKSLSDAFAALAARFPDDDETQIFSALYLTATQLPSDKSFAATLRAAGILEKQFAKHPNHPGVAHYLIHSYDYPAIADRGLVAALCYDDIAASAPHALHMPSHIFTRIGAWEKSVSANLRSAALADTQHESSDELHALDYMAYADLQLGRDGEAAHVVAEARKVTDAPATVQSGPYASAAIPARYVIERGAWSEAKDLQPAPSRFPFAPAITYFARALGEARSGDPAAAEKDAQELARLVDVLKTAKNDYWATETEVQRLGASAWIAYAKGERDTGLKLMRDASDKEDASDKSALTPGRLVPARELLGDMLMESGKPADALVEYEAAQTHDPKRFRSVYGAGMAAVQAGDHDKAKLYLGRLVEMAGKDDTRPELAKARDYLASN